VTIIMHNADKEYPAVCPSISLDHLHDICCCQAVNDILGFCNELRQS
jgi:hypothetical protein